MAHIEYRKNKRGDITSARVIWRDKGDRLTESFKKIKAAEQWFDILNLVKDDTRQAESLVRRRLSEAPPFSEIADLHIKRLTDVEQATRNKYRSMYTNHLEQPFSDRPVDSITEDDVADWIMDTIEDGKSPKTIRNVHGLLHSIMKTAIKRKHRLDNPCTESRLPKNNRIDEAILFLTHGEFELLLNEIPEHHKPFVLFMVGTGLRFSEATALTPADFTDNNGKYSVSIQKAWKDRGDGTRYIGPPKSERGRRTVGMGARLAQTVAPVVANCAPGDTVFKMVAGGQMTSQAFYNRVWRAAVNRAQDKGLRKQPRVHDLRHTFASWMLEAGMSISVLSYLMGHESEQTTRNVYAHMMPSLVNSSAEIANDAMSQVYSLLDAPKALDSVIDAEVIT